MLHKIILKIMKLIIKALCILKIFQTLIKSKYLVITLLVTVQAMEEYFICIILV